MKKYVIKKPDLLVGGSDGYYVRHINHTPLWSYNKKTAHIFETEEAAEAFANLVLSAERRWYVEEINVTGNNAYDKAMKGI
jgi:hypothetical protein